MRIQYPFISAMVMRSILSIQSDLKWHVHLIVFQSTRVNKLGLAANIKEIGVINIFI